MMQWSKLKGQTWRASELFLLVLCFLISTLCGSSFVFIKWDRFSVLRVRKASDNVCCHVTNNVIATFICMLKVVFIMFSHGAIFYFFSMVEADLDCSYHCRWLVSGLCAYGSRWDNQKMWILLNLAQDVGPSWLIFSV